MQEEKKTIDNRIETQRFANIVRHKQHYDNVENEFTEINDFLQEKIAGARKFAQDLLKIEYKRDTLFGGIFNIVQGNVVID